MIFKYLDINYLTSISGKYLVLR